MSVSNQGWRGGHTEEQHPEAGAGASSPACWASGGPGVWEDMSKQSWKVEERPEWRAGGSEDRTGGHVGHHSCPARTEVNVYHRFIVSRFFIPHLLTFYLMSEPQDQERAGGGRTEEGHRWRNQKPWGTGPGNETETCHCTGRTVRAAGTGQEGEGV